MSKTATITAAVLLTVSSLAMAQTSPGTTSRPSATTNGSSATTGTAGSSAMSESQLKKQLEQQGYSDIKLHEDSATAQKGDWSGTAKKGGKEVNIHVDQTGRVTER
jgi:mannitol-specific phosphotransferase system IIBC component